MPHSNRPTTHPDAFGLELWSVFTGASAMDIVERSDGYVDAADAGAYFAPFEQWAPRQQRAMGLVKGVALDAGCGAGRVSLHLQSAGVTVVAIDTSPLAIRICRKRGVTLAKRVGLEDVGRIRRTFDTVLLLGNNFGLFGSRAKAKRLLQMLHRRTSDDAVLLAESVNPYLTKNPVHRQYQADNRKRGRISGQLRLRVRFRNVASPWFDYLFVSPDEMTDIAKGTGWQVVELIDGDQPTYIGVMTKRLG